MKKWIALMLALTMALAGCGKGKDEGASEGGESSDNKQLIISTWGLGEDNLMKDVFTPFEEEFGAKTVLEFASTSERLTKLKENPDVEMDIIELNQASAAEAEALGLFEKLDLSKIPNAANIIEPAKVLTENGYSIPFVVNSVGIIYNPNGAKGDIKDWADLWDPALKNRIAVPDISTTFGPAFVALAGEVAGVPIEQDNGEAAFAKIAELKPNIVKSYAKSSDLAIMFTNDEVDAAIVGDFAVNIIKEAFPEAVYLVPESGTYANYNVISIPKNSKNKELAYEFINYRISEATQLRTAASLNEAPTNKNVELTEELQLNKTYGDVAARAKTIDFKVVNDNLSSWIDQFNRLMSE